MKRTLALLLLSMLALTPAATGATIYSNKHSFGGPGLFYGPGHFKDAPLFDVTIRNVGFTFPLNFVTPFSNNGGAYPNICGEAEMGKTPTGRLSDGETSINENVDTCTFKLNDLQILVAIIEGGPHAGQQVSVAYEDGVMIMTMDFALDLGIGKGGIIRLPFYGTTGEVTVPYSLQTQLGIEGGIDQAGSYRAGDTLRGRLGDFNNDGLLDGAIVVAGNMPLDSIILPGAPYALIRYFETDIPYLGKVIGRLPGERPRTEPPPLRVTEPPAEPTISKPLGRAFLVPSSSALSSGPSADDALQALGRDPRAFRTTASYDPARRAWRNVDLWSVQDSYLGPGKFFGPGANDADQVLFEAQIRNMVFVTDIDFVTPFFNNGPDLPNSSAEVAFASTGNHPVDGRLSNGLRINENADLGLMEIAGTRLLPAVVSDGRYEGHQMSITSEQGDVTMTMDFALDLGIGERGVIRLPFYGTTGTLTVPPSLQTQGGQPGGIDRAGPLVSGSTVTGRIGDFNGDGWIDGTLVAVGAMPLSSPLYPGQPYVVVRYFETNIPLQGTTFGSIVAKKNAAAPTSTPESNQGRQ